MKVIFILVLFSFTNIILADSSEDFNRANYLYSSGKFSEAAKLYESIKNNNINDEKLYYNLANSYFRIGKLGFARLNYERALKIDQNDEDINFNLSVTKARLKDKIEPLPQLFLITSVSTFFNKLDSNVLIIMLVIVVLLITLFSFLVYYYGPNLKLKYTIIVYSFTFILTCILSISLYHKLNNYYNNNYGIIVIETINAKSTPSENGNNIFNIHEGLKIYIEDSLDGWTKIRLEDGKIGWVPDNSFERI